MHLTPLFKISIFVKKNKCEKIKKKSIKQSGNNPLSEIALGRERVRRTQTDQRDTFTA